MVRHKNRPVRSLSPEETGSTPRAEDGAEEEARAGGKASPSLSFWAVEWAAGSDEAPSPQQQQQPQGKTSKPNDNTSLSSSRDGSTSSGARSSLAFAPSSSPSSSLAASMPLSMIMSMAKSKADDKGEPDESEEEDYCHPLSNVQGMPAFSDLQVTIAKAIVKRAGRRDGAASVEDILDYVTKKWKNLRRKDGSQYSSASTYIRRAVQANLRSTANGVALFKMDREGYWSVCQTIDEAKSPIRLPSRESLNVLPTPRAAVQQKSAVSPGEDEFWASLKEEPLSPSASSPPQPMAELTKEEMHFYEAAKSRMTALQRTVSECILQSGGSCHFEFILDTVQKKWVEIKNEDGTAPTQFFQTFLHSLSLTDPDPDLPRIANLKKLVGACVARDRGEDSKSLFQRDHNAESSGYWKLGLTNPYAKTSGLAFGPEEDELPSAASHGASVTDHGHISSGSSSSGSRRNTPLTHLQEMIVEAIAANGEAADLESIYAFIKERWQGLTRRDGTPYTADIRRAVQSSLSNNSSLSPIFVKLPETEQSMWGLAARGKAFLRERQRKRMAQQQQQEALVEDEDDDDDDDDDDHSASPFGYGRGFANGGGGSNGSVNGNGLGSPNGNLLGANAGARQEKPKKKRKKKNQFSGIQQMIADVMERNGGSAPFDLILSECQKRWRTLRKRDGTPYNADPKRSINASLTKTPAYGQVFERDPRLEGYWRLTPAAQKVWDQLRKGPEPAQPQAVIIPRMLMMPRMNLMLNPVGLSPLMESHEVRPDEEEEPLPTANRKLEDDLQRKRNRERERREKKRREKEAAKSASMATSADAALADGDVIISSGSVMAGSPGEAFSAVDSGSFTHFPRGLMKEDGIVAEDEEEEEEGIDGRRTKKRAKREESERDEMAGDEDELEYGEGSGEAPKLATMQALVIRAIRKHGGSSSFRNIYDTLCEKVEKDKGLMSAVNWARVHRSNFPTGSEEEDRHNVKIFSRDEQGNWIVPDLKLSDWVMKHKRKRIKLDKFVPKKKTRMEE